MKTSLNFPIFTCHRTLLDLRLAIFRRHPRKLGVEHWYLLRFPSQWICNQCIQYWGWGGRIACSGLSLLKRQPWKTYTAWQRCLMAQLGYIVSMRPIQRKVEVISRRPYIRMRVVLEPGCRIAKSRRSLISYVCQYGPQFCESICQPGIIMVWKLMIQITRIGSNFLTPSLLRWRIA